MHTSFQITVSRWLKSKEITMSSREKRKAEWLSSALAKKVQEQLQQTIKKILYLGPEQRDADQQALLSQHQTLVAQIRKSLGASQVRKKVKAEHEKEVEDPPSVLEEKLRTLADLIEHSRPRVVFHTGAGLSTPAGIPDFRGPQGVWTLQQKGQVAAMRLRYEDAQPTKAHMLIAEMVRRGIVSHVVSQNVDGLLLRAGVRADRLSELHGCVHTEVCSSCGHRYTRGYDVTAANGTAFRRHVTGRLCKGEVGDAKSAEEVNKIEDERDPGDATSAGEDPPYEMRDEREVGDATSAEEDVPDKPGEEPVRKWVRIEEAKVLDRGEGRGDREDACAPATSSEQIAAELVEESELQVKEGGEQQQESTCASGRPRERSSAIARRLCGGALRDTIVHFGERLDDEVLRTAREASAAADLAVALGTSLKVPPASTLPGLASTAVIVNLQWTAKDKRAALKINGRCEVVMQRLAELLDLGSPEYRAAEDPVLKLDVQERGESIPNCKVEQSTDKESHTLKGRSKNKHKSKTEAAFPRPLL